MNRTRRTAEQIIRKLKTAEQLIAPGKTFLEVCRDIEVSRRTNAGVSSTAGCRPRGPGS